MAVDGSAAICARTESERRAGHAGWLHRSTNDWKQDQWIPAPRIKPPKLAIELEALNERCVGSLQPELRGWLSNELGITPVSIQAFQVGFHPDKNVFSFPMRRPDGTISGIRYRTFDGKKFSETGGREGLFYLPGSLGKTLIIVEGPTDAMAVHDLGFHLVIGRSNCRGNVAQIKELISQVNPSDVIIIPDNDQPGIDGAESLIRELIEFQAVKTLLLPEGIKDVRACIQSTKNADWLRNQIGKSICTPSWTRQAHEQL